MGEGGRSSRICLPVEAQGNSPSQSSSSSQVKVQVFLFHLSKIYHICMSNLSCMDRNPLLSILAMKPVPILLLKKMPRPFSLIPIILLFSAIQMTIFRSIHFHFQLQLHILLPILIRLSLKGSKGLQLAYVVVGGEKVWLSVLDTSFHLRIFSQIVDLMTLCFVLSSFVIGFFLSAQGPLLSLVASLAFIPCINRYKNLLSGIPIARTLGISLGYYPTAPPKKSIPAYRTQAKSIA